MVNRISLIINGEQLDVKAGISILDACKTAGVIVPRFCYHETLSIAGNCRMCLVEVEGLEKPVASCLTEVSDNMIVYTDSIFAKKARENVLETLLVNHPLDCPVCDQAGECDLQDQTKSYASNHSKYLFNKRGVEDKNCGVLIHTIMTRCIHCTRCVRFSSEVAGIDFLGTFNRGTSTEIGGYADNFFRSEISGNVIDLCPVGALTAKSFGYKARPWELRVNESIDITDSTGSNIYIYFKDTIISRILPKSNENINGQLITDGARFSYDSSLTNRLKHIFFYNKSVEKERSISWTKFFKKTDSLVSSDKILFNLSDDIGLETLAQLTKISRTSNGVNVMSLNGKVENNNFYLWGLTDKIKSIDTCDSLGLTFSLNPKIECAVINARLRTRTLNSLLSFVSMNLNFNSNMSNRSVNLNLSKSLRIIEGKYLDYAKKFNFADSPLVLMGESLKKRGVNIVLLMTFLKSNFDSAKVIKINSGANSEALEFLNIRNILQRKYFLIATEMCLNLDDNLKVRRSIFNPMKNIFWFNSHASKFKTEIQASIPILSEYEEEKIFLNLEQRPQKTNNIFQKFFDSRSLKKVLLSMFQNQPEFAKQTNISDFKFMSYIFEIVKNPWIFDKLDSVFTLLSVKKVSLRNKVNFLLKYPTKYSLDNFFTGCKALKNSLIMGESAAEYWNSNFSY